MRKLTKDLIIQNDDNTFSITWPDCNFASDDLSAQGTETFNTIAQAEERLDQVIENEETLYHAGDEVFSQYRADEMVRELLCEDSEELAFA